MKWGKNENQSSFCRIVVGTLGEGFYSRLLTYVQVSKQLGHNDLSIAILSCFPDDMAPLQDMLWNEQGILSRNSTALTIL